MYTCHLYEETSDSASYYFSSPGKGKYFVKFTRATYLFKTVCSSCQSIYEVSFTPEKPEKGYDEKIKKTIISLMKEFIQENRCPLLYVCDSLDNKHISRLKLFQNWFKDVGDTEYKHDYRFIDLEDYSIILGIVAFKWDSYFDDYFDQIETY